VKTKTAQIPFIITGVVVGILIILIAFLGFSIRRSFPKLNGEIYFQELKEGVDIYRDQMGIPHIFASTEYDLFFAQGFVHAQDRFWQMDFWRHQGAGRLSELLGEATLETDIFLRTLGWERVARQELAELDAETLAILQAYADGVNAYLSDHSGTALSLEYLFLNIVNDDYQPKPWTAINTLTWPKAMAWDLGSSQLNRELDRALLSKTLSLEEIALFFPTYPKDRPVIVNHPQLSTFNPSQSPTSQNVLGDSALSLEYLASPLESKPFLNFGSSIDIGSNSWVVSGDLTNTGMPIFANDPHLGQQIPSIWYQIGLHCEPISPDCQYSIAGFSFAGVPGVIIGHNEHITWGMTNVGPDVIDLFIEKINPQNPDQYEYNGNWQDMETITERIEIAGKEPFELKVQITKHGPIITSAYDLESNLEGANLEIPEQYAIAIRWPALEPTILLDSILNINRASNWEEFRSAASKFSVPSQNLLYADIYGNIGYQMPGLIPIRPEGNNGKYPVPGWTSEHDWQGYIPFEDLPFAFNPPEGYIVTANNAVVGLEYPYFITDDWAPGLRAQRIVDMLEDAPSPITIDYIQQMQGDNYNLFAEEILPILLSIDLEAVLIDPTERDSSSITEAEERILHLDSTRSILQDWDYHNDMSSAPAALFNAFWRHLAPATFNDELPNYFPASIHAPWMEIIRKIMYDPKSSWWDNRNTRPTEDRDDIFVYAFSQAVDELEDKLGKNPAKWAWSDLHTITFTHTFMNNFPFINNLFNRGPYANSGGSAIVNATSWSANSYTTSWMPSMRMIVDLSNLDASLTVHTTGQSGHAYHSHYADMPDLWRKIQYYPMYWERASIEANAANHLELTPTK
jgi:penicillin amidase